MLLCPPLPPLEPQVFACDLFPPLKICLQMNYIFLWVGFSIETVDRTIDSKLYSSSYRKKYLLRIQADIFITVLCIWSWQNVRLKEVDAFSFLLRMERVNTNCENSLGVYTTVLTDCFECRDFSAVCDDERWWSDTSWATLIRLRLCSLSSYLEIIVMETSLQFHGEIS